MPPALPLTYPDLVYTDDMDLFARETASDLENAEQDVYHILVETSGSNLDDPLRGVGLPTLLSGDSSQLDGLQHEIESQLRKDARIDSSSAIVSQTGEGAFALNLEVAVGAETLGLSYSFNAVGGLVPT